jgi:hypothetical protein
LKENVLNIFPILITIHRYGQPAGGEGTDEAAIEAEKPNFGLSGKLTEYTNTYKVNLCSYFILACIMKKLYNVC